MTTQTHIFRKYLLETDYACTVYNVHMAWGPAIVCWSKQVSKFSLNCSYQEYLTFISKFHKCFNIKFLLKPLHTNRRNILETCGSICKTNIFGIYKKNMFNINSSKLFTVVCLTTKLMKFLSSVKKKQQHCGKNLLHWWRINTRSLKKKKLCKRPAVRMFKLEWQRRLTWLCRTANAVCFYTAKCIYDSMEQKMSSCREGFA